MKNIPKGYKKLIEELRDSPNHQSLIYYAFENLLNTSLERKRLPASAEVSPTVIQ